MTRTEQYTLANAASLINGRESQGWSVKILTYAYGFVIVVYDKDAP